MDWLDSTAPEVRSAVISGGWGKTPHSDSAHAVPVDVGQIDTIAAAVSSASEILSRFTAFTIHPAVQVTEDFIPTPRAHRLSVTFSPLRKVVSVTRVLRGGLTEVVADGWTGFAGDIYFDSSCATSLDSWYVSVCGCSPEPNEKLRVVYNAGSTITASARRAVITLAHTFWLDVEGCDECALPERTTAVQREGLSFQLSDPDGVLTGRTGIPSIDAWIRAVNPHNAVRPAGVWTPDSPPAVVTGLRVARPIFPVPVVTP